MDDGERVATETAPRHLGNALDGRTGDHRVHRVATVAQHLQSRFRCERMPRGHCPVPADGDLRSGGQRRSGRSDGRSS